LFIKFSEPGEFSSVPLQGVINPSNGNAYSGGKKYQQGEMRVWKLNQGVVAGVRRVQDPRPVEERGRFRRDRIIFNAFI
jgi:hypothetical protein